jgi:hypothetical protein
MLSPDDPGDKSRVPRSAPEPQAAKPPNEEGLLHVDESQLRAAGAGGGSLNGDGAFEDLGFEERLHQFVVGAVA